MTSKVDIPIDGPIGEYGREHAVYERFARTLEEILKRAVGIHAPMAIVQSRAKTVSSFAEKIIRKHKYTDPLRQVTDLCGVRVITHFQSQATALAGFVKANFEIDETNSLDAGSRLRQSEFGYLSLHYIVTPVDNEILGVPVPREFKDRKAEIQIRTLLQHAWADISHDRIYKTPILVQNTWKRDSARLAAVLEKTDDSFAAMASALDAYSENYGVLLSPKELEQEIKTLRTVLDSEPEADRKPAHALRLARALGAMDRWEDAVKALRPYCSSGCDREICIELGHAICRVHKEKPLGGDFAKGQKRIDTVARSSDPVLVQDKYDTRSHAACAGNRLRAKALYALGRTWELIPGKNKEALACFSKAGQIQPENPYYYVAYLTYTFAPPGSHALIPAVSQTLRDTIQECRKHIETRVELPNAYLAMATCHYLLKEFDESLNACAKVVDLALSGTACISDSLLVDALRRMRILASFHPETMEVLSAILHVLRWRRGDHVSKDKRIRNSAKVVADLRCRQKRYDEDTVLIIAGGAELMPDRFELSGMNYIYESLEAFDGLVLSGGTTSGIPGWVGKVTDALKQKGKKNYRLVGYLPKDGSVPADAKEDKENYDELVRSTGNGFTARELVGYWIDLLRSNVDPKKVLVLGINGGRISDLEYRLALAFGATVGLVENTGRAAAGLLADPDWQEHNRLLVLPADARIIWAYANMHKRPAALTQKEIEEMAPLVHQRYVDMKLARMKEDDAGDLSMVPWKALPASLKASNIQQVAFMGELLRKAGFEIRKAAGEPNARPLPKGRIKDLAKLEHARWVVERLGSGWTYGTTKDIEKKISPYLVGWDGLTDQTKRYDMDAVTDFPELLASAGYEIVEI